MSMKLMEIEHELSGDNRQVAMARYDATLRTLAERLDEALRLGVSPEAFPVLSALQEATTLSRKLLRLTVHEAADDAESPLRSRRAGVLFQP